MTNIVPKPQKMPVLRLEDYNALQNETAGAAIKSYIFFGFLVACFFVGGSAYWAASSKIDGAVVAPANFVVDGNRKTVDHLEGGIVRKIHVRDGDLVEVGQTLVELDNTDLRVDLDVLESQLGDLMVRRAYLLAQIFEEDTFEAEDVAKTVGSHISTRAWQASFQTQRRLFDAERRTRQSQEAVRDQQVASLNGQIAGLQTQRAANARQLEITREELANLQALFERKLVTADRINSRRAEIERLAGLDASFQTEKARARNQIEEIKLAALSDEQLRTEQHASELVAVESEIARVGPQFLGTQSQQKRLLITAPVSGRVVGMTIFTDGGVVRPGAPILDIVPAEEDLVVEARVRTVDIDKLFVGQTTRVRLSAFGQSDVPEAVGTIVNVSADSLEDERTGQTYYSATISLDDVQTADIAALTFLPGMPADVFINTGERTALTYLVQPIKDRLARTFIE